VNDIKTAVGCPTQKMMIAFITSEGSRTLSVKSLCSDLARFEVAVLCPYLRVFLLPKQGYFIIQTSNSSRLDPTEQHINLNKLVNIHFIHLHSLPVCKAYTRICLDFTSLTRRQQFGEGVRGFDNHSIQVQNLSFSFKSLISPRIILLQRP